MINKTKPYPAIRKSRRSRVWLNSPVKGGRAHIMWEVTVPQFHKAKKGGYINGPWCELSIADCSRTISLDFDLSARGGEKRSAEKIDKLIWELTKFKAAMLGACERRAELKRENPKAKCYD